MAGLTHFAVGLAAKSAAPKIPLALLIISAYVIDIVWGVFFLASLKAATLWSHSLLMAVVWSLLAGLLAWRFVDKRAGLVIGLLVFSHWLVDFISHPMTAVFPDDTGLPIFFADSPLVGLGAWRTQLGVIVGEYGVFVLGLAIYLVTLRRLRRQHKAKLAQS